MAGWLLGALVAAGFAAFGGAQVVVLVSERGPTTLSCRALLETGTSARWVRLSDCLPRWERARPFSDQRRQKGLYVPLEGAPGTRRGPGLLARVDADADAKGNPRMWEGLLDVRATEDRPPFAAASTRILYVHRPDPIEIILSVGAPLVYLVTAVVALRRRRRRRAALERIVLRFPPRGSVAPPGLQVLRLDPLLDARRTIRRAWPVVVGTLALLLLVVAAPLLEHGSVPAALWLRALAAPAGALLVSRWLWTRLPTDRRLALVGIMAFLFAACLVLSLTGPGAPATMFMSLAFLPAPVCVAFVMARARRRLLEHPEWQTLAAVDVGVTSVSARRLPRHESLRRRPVRIVLYRIAALAVAGLGLLVAAILGVSPVAWIGLAVGVAFWRRARRHASLDAREVRERDPRAPVALLRSFADDELEMSGLSEFVWSPPTTLTWVAAEKLASIGPVVAVGEPGEGLPPLGPYRLFLPAAEWRDEVDRLIATARAVFVVLGRSPGLRWELERIVRGRSPGGATLIVPPGPPEELERRWENLLGLAKDPPGWRLAEHLDPTTLLLFRPLPGDAALAISASRRDGFAYALAFSVCAAIDAGSVAAAPRRPSGLRYAGTSRRGGSTIRRVPGDDD